MSLLDILLPAQICFQALQQDEEVTPYDGRGRSRNRAYSDGSTSCYSCYTVSSEEESVVVTMTKDAQAVFLQLLLGSGAKDNNDAMQNGQEEEGEDFIDKVRHRLTSEELDNESLLQELMNDVSFDSEDDEDFETYSQENEDEGGCCGWVYIPCSAENKLEEQIWYQMTYQMTWGKICAGNTTIEDDEATAEETVFSDTDEEKTIETEPDAMESIEDVTTIEKAPPSVEEIAVIVEPPHKVIMVETLEEIPANAPEEAPVEPGGWVLSDKLDDLLENSDPKGVKSINDDEESLVGEGEPVVARFSVEGSSMEPDGAKMAIGQQAIEVQDHNMTRGAVDEIELVYLENFPGDIVLENGSVTSSNWSAWAVQEDDEILERTFWEPSVEPTGIKLEENSVYSTAISQATSELGKTVDLLEQLNSLPYMNRLPPGSFDDEEFETSSEECDEHKMSEHEGKNFESEGRQRSESVSSEEMSLD